MIYNMTTKLYVKKIIKPTKAKMFKDIKVGDCIDFSVPLKRAGSNRGRTYSTNITCTYLDEKVLKSFNELGNILDCFEFYTDEENNPCCMD